MHQYQVKGLVFDDHFEDETFHRRTVVRLGDLDFKPFTAPTLIKSVNFAHRNHRAKGGAQSTWTAVLLLFRCKTHVLQALLQGYKDFFLVKHFAAKPSKISSPADSLIPLRKSLEFSSWICFIKMCFKSRWCNFCNAHGGFMAFKLAHGTSVRSKLFSFCRWIVPKISCSPFRHPPSSIIHSESWLPWSNNIFPTGKNGKNWEGKSCNATHTLKNKNLVNVNYEKPYYTLRSK